MKGVSSFGGGTGLLEHVMDADLNEKLSGRSDPLKLQQMLLNCGDEAGDVKIGGFKVRRVTYFL